MFSSAHKNSTFRTRGGFHELLLDLSVERRGARFKKLEVLKFLTSENTAWFTYASAFLNKCSIKIRACRFSLCLRSKKDCYTFKTAVNGN